jgi:hypothetical protein
MNPFPMSPAFFPPPMWGWGKPPFRHFENPHYHGFCHQCCHPVAACCCGRPHCRKEAKELVAVPGQPEGDKTGVLAQHPKFMAFMTSSPAFENLEETKDTRQPAGERVQPERPATGSAFAFIGGGCCVHLSVEYMLLDPLAQTSGSVRVGVTDSHQTTLLWAKAVLPQSHYEIHEDILTTYAGAALMLVVRNAVARVRWCEVFSG